MANGEETSQSDVSADKDLVLELNFVPEWARKPPRDGDYGAVRTVDEMRRGRERPRRGKPSGETRRAGPSRKSSVPPKRYVAPFPAEISFLPDSRQLKSVVHQIRAARRAYPLMELAGIFLTKPEYHRVKIELKKDDASGSLYQCTACRMAATERQIIVSHILKNHAGNYFDEEEIEVEAPSGNFTCMGVCGLSGELLGPPNHHNYSENMMRIHRTRFAGMSFKEYSEQVKTVRDPELVDKWKDDCRKQKRYKVKAGTEEAGESMKWADVESRLVNDIAPSLITETRRVIMPGGICVGIEDGRLELAVREAFQKERRFPFTLSLALRAAFRHMKLHVFKAGRGHSFVSFVRPSPLKSDHVLESIGEVLSYLKAHPGCTRGELVESLRPGRPDDSPEAAELLSPLGWMIERGHIIEFFNGTLAIPQGR